MKQLLSILLCSLIFILSTKDIGTYVAFKLNQEFIANNWCVNINNPAVNCCGKCFLKKEWKENQEDKEDNSPVPQLEESTKNYYYSALQVFRIKDIDFASNNNFYHSCLISQLFTPNFLDPPEGSSLS